MVRQPVWRQHSCSRGQAAWHLQRGLAEPVIEQLHVALLLLQLLFQLCDPSLQAPLLIQQGRPRHKEGASAEQHTV